MGDTHQCIINGHTEVVDGKSVAPQHHEIAQAVCVPCHFPTNNVVDCQLQDGGTVTGAKGGTGREGKGDGDSQLKNFGSQAQAGGVLSYAGGTPNVIIE